MQRCLWRVMLSLKRTRKRALAMPGYEWAANNASALQVALAGYFVSGAFLNAAYFDLAWLYFAFGAIFAKEIAGAKGEQAALAARHAMPLQASVSPGTATIARTGVG